MILRLVYSFFFFCLVTGNQRDHYGYPAQGMISANPVQSINPQARSETVEYVSDDSPSLQIRPVRDYVKEEKEHYEKTLCITPSMVHKMIKAALEYVIQMPSEINNLIAKLDQELNRMSDNEYVVENTVKKPLYPLDSKTIFQMLDKPKSESRTNLILKYELPSVKEPFCREALEKLIEIAYTAYTQLEQHPQCREYLYNFAAHQPEDFSTGQLNQAPDVKSLIATILDQIDKQKPNLNMTPESDRFGDLGIPEIPENQDYEIPQNQEHNIPQNHQFNIPQTHEYNIPQSHEYNIPQNREYNIPQIHENGNTLQKPQMIEYNINEYSVPDVSEYNVPRVPEYNINQYNVPNYHEFNKPVLNLPKVHEYTITGNHEYNVPKVQEYTITENREYNVPKVQEYTFTENHEYNVPKVHEYTFTENHEYNVPKVPEYTMTENREYGVPKVHEYTITQNHEYNVPKVHEYTITNEYNIPQIQDIPQAQSIELPEIIETKHETMEIKPMQPEETINILIKLLKKSDQPDSGNLFDRLTNIVQENQNNFHPRVLKLLLTLLNVHKQNNIHRFNDIFLLLLDSQRNRDWPFSDRVTDDMLSYLSPDNNGNLDSRIVEIILNLYKKRPNEKHVEYILSLLRLFKEGNMDNRVRDIMLKLIDLHQNNLLHPDYVDVLLKFLKPGQNGNSNPIDVDIADNVSRWNEIGMTPNQLNGIFALLKPYVNGQTDHRPIDIIHFLLTKNKNLNPKHLDFILSFLHPENGVVDTRRIDIILFLLNNVTRYPKQANILLTLLQENAPGILNSRFLEILLFLDNQKLLKPELVETIVSLLKNEITGKLDENQVKSLFFQLAPYKQSNPKIIMDVLTLLNQGGLYGNIAEWLENTNNNVGLPNRDATPVNQNIVNQNNANEYRTPDGGYQTMDVDQQMPNHDFMSIFKWLDSQGLITQDQGSNTDLVNKILNILEAGQRELGVVELTYMLKHEKPLIYQPVYYVKYRLPILSFISNMKTLLLENPNLNADPMKLLQELIVISNVTEVSPNLQGYPKEEILKLTFNDGDLVQAKILDEQNLNLNDQISYVHGLNADISPEEILQLNRMNEMKYFQKIKEVKGVHPDKLSIKDVDKFIEVPVTYRHIEMNPGVITTHTKTIHTSYNIARENQDQNAIDNNNDQLNTPQN